MSVVDSRAVGLAGAQTCSQSLRDELMAPWKGQLPTPAPTAGYRLGLLLAALAMLLLPLIYLSLILGVGWGVYWYAVHGLSVFDGARGRHSGTAALIGYVGPLFTGATLLVFMVKPLFSRAKNTQHPLVLVRSEEPLLFEFVDRLARYVGAPSPRQIEVDCDVNAHARFRRGLISIPGRELVLRIGLPIVSSLPVRNVAGILAHEFGHFAQRGGMTTTYIIRSVSHWFARVVYQRDSWDNALDTLSRSGGWWGILIIANLARLFVWLTRKILWCLMMAGHVIASIMLRQMEFDADRYEAHVAGSDAFGKTSFALRKIHIARHQAYGTIQSSWNEKRLPDDVPTLIAKGYGRLPAEVDKPLAEEVAAGKTGWLDTHPCDRERIAAAGAMNVKGVLKSDLPATALFSRFEELARRATLAHYFELIGPDVKPENLTPVDAVIEQAKQRTDNFKALDRYAQGVIRPIALATPTMLPEVHDVEAATVRLLELRNQLRESAPAVCATLNAIEKSRQEARTADLFRTLKMVGYKKLPHAEFGLKRGDDLEVNAVIEQARKLDAESAHRVRESQQLVTERLALALALESKTINIPMSAAVIDEDSANDRGEYDIVAADPPDASTSLVRTLSGLLNLASDMQELFVRVGRLRILLMQLQPKDNAQALIDAILARGRAVGETITAILPRVPDSPYPFRHADRSITVRGYLTGAQPPPPADHPGELFDFASALVERHAELFGHALAELVRRAEAVERHLGLEPLELPAMQPQADA